MLVEAGEGLFELVTVRTAVGRGLNDQVPIDASDSRVVEQVKWRVRADLDPPPDPRPDLVAAPGGFDVALDPAALRFSHGFDPPPCVR